MLKFITTLSLVLLISSCKDSEIPMPEGYEHVKMEAQIHFVYVSDKTQFGDQSAQRMACKKICEKFKHTEYCEIYLWKDRSKVAERLPVRWGEGEIGHYSIKGKKVRLKPLR